MKVLSVQSFKAVRVECRSPYRTKGAIRDGHLRLQLIVLRHTTYYQFNFATIFPSFRGNLLPGQNYHANVV